MTGAPEGAAGPRPAEGLVLCADGSPRCSWAASDPLYLDYHDSEWGRPVTDDPGLFERLSLEGFQSGLSWLVILRKRPAFRRAFSDFDPDVVSRFTDDDVQRLLGDAGIVRNRQKIAATIANARVLVEMESPLSTLLWSFAPPPTQRPARPADVPAVTVESTAMAKALRKSGFRFVGPTTCYALMQAVGMVDDHLAGCSAPVRRSGRPAHA
jgi:DNA-3-methyladenine glycosylase I